MRGMRAPVSWIIAAAGAALAAPAAYPVTGVNAGPVSPASALDADLAQVPAAPRGGPEGVRFTHGLAGWQVLGPGAVTVRAGDHPARYLAIRDNSTVVSASFTVPATHQMLFVTARGPVGNPRLRVLARRAGRPDLVLGSIAPGRTWKTYPLGARSIAGTALQLVLDPVMARTDALDLANPGESGVVAPGLAIAQGSAERIHRGPGSAQLSLRPGPFSARTLPFAVARDAVTVSVWVRALADGRPTVRLSALGRSLGETSIVGGWQPVRVAASALRGRAVALAVASPDATGLQLGLIGTVQRAAHLSLARRTTPAGTVLAIRASPLLARARLTLDVTRASGRVQQREIRLGATARTRLLLRGVGPAATLELVYAGSELVAPATRGTP